MMGCADQVMVSGLSLYFPLNTGPVWDMRPYNIRSAMTSGIVIYTDIEGQEFSTKLAPAGDRRAKQGCGRSGRFLSAPAIDHQPGRLVRLPTRPAGPGRGCVLVFRRPEAPGRRAAAQAADRSGGHLPGQRQR